MLKMSVLMMVLAGGTVAGAVQEAPKTPPNETAPAAPAVASDANDGLRINRIPLKVTVVLSRYQEDKRLSSLPYVLGVTSATPGTGPKTSLRMGVDVPVMHTVFGAAKSDAAQVPQASYSYRSVGTSIDCHASGPHNGVFQLQMTVADSSVQLQPSSKESAPEALRNVPTFRTLNSSFTVLMRDGQTTQHTSATDPVTGEVMRIDVTLNVVK